MMPGKTLKKRQNVNVTLGEDYYRIAEKIKAYEELSWPEFMEIAAKDYIDKYVMEGKLDKKQKITHKINEILQNETEKN